MPQFDIHRLKNGRGFVLDCQADILDNLPTRFVVPMVEAGPVPELALRFSPGFVVAGEKMRMATNIAATVARTELGEVVASLAEESHRVIGAIDVLITGV